MSINSGVQKSKYSVIVWLILLLLGVGFIMIDGDGSRNAILIFTCLIFVFELMYALKKMQDRIFFLCFLLAFFTFLLSGEILDRYVGVFSTSFTPEIDKHTDLCLLLSLIGLFIGIL